MAIIEKDRTKKIVIDLSRPEGNAFFLLGAANRYGKQLGFSSEKISNILSEMKAGDYDNLIKVFDREFGDYIDLEY